jgi:hypothetical protein
VAVRTAHPAKRIKLAPGSGRRVVLTMANPMRKYQGTNEAIVEANRLANQALYIPRSLGEQAVVTKQASAKKAVKPSTRER